MTFCCHRPEVRHQLRSMHGRSAYGEQRCRPETPDRRWREIGDRAVPGERPANNDVEIIEYRLNHQVTVESRDGPTPFRYRCTSSNGSSKRHTTPQPDQQPVADAEHRTTRRTPYPQRPQRAPIGTRPRLQPHTPSSDWRRCTGRSGSTTSRSSPRISAVTWSSALAARRSFARSSVADADFLVVRHRDDLKRFSSRSAYPASGHQHAGVRHAERHHVRDG